MQPVGGVFQPVEQQVEEAAELPLQPAADVARQLVRLSGALRRNLAVGAEQQAEERLLNGETMRQRDKNTLFCLV